MPLTLAMFPPPVIKQRRRPLAAAAPRSSLDDDSLSVFSAPGTEEGVGVENAAAAAGGGCPVLPFRSSSSSSTSTSSFSSSSSSRPSSPPPAPKDLPLPPGTVGLPFLGETVEMFRGPSLFHGKRRERQGDIYKTTILGGPVVTIHDARECRRLLLADGTETETNWPKITRRLMGEHSILLQTGKKHAAQRRLLGQAFTRDAVDGYAPLVEEAVSSNLESWARQGCVKGMGSGKDLAFEVAARALVASGGENEEEDMSQEMMEAFRHDFDRVVVREREREREIFHLFEKVKNSPFFLLSFFSKTVFNRRAPSRCLTTSAGSRNSGAPSRRGSECSRGSTESLRKR